MSMANALRGTGTLLYKEVLRFWEGQFSDGRRHRS